MWHVRVKVKQEGVFCFRKHHHINTRSTIEGAEWNKFLRVVLVRRPKPRHIPWLIVLTFRNRCFQVNQIEINENPRLHIVEGARKYLLRTGKVATVSKEALPPYIHEGSRRISWIAQQSPRLPFPSRFREHYLKLREEVTNNELFNQECPIGFIGLATSNREIVSKKLSKSIVLLLKRQQPTPLGLIIPGIQQCTIPRQIMKSIRQKSLTFHQQRFEGALMVHI